MTELLAGAALLILAMTGAGLFAVLRTRSVVDCMMAVQLAGTAGAAVALLLGTAARVKGATDLAIMLALLSAVSCAAFTLGERAGDATSAEAEEDA
jgi:multicomponent Na+:H+ antiporter subunit F